MIVDAVTEVLQVAARAVTPPPGIVKGLGGRNTSPGSSVENGRTIVVLNTNKLLNSKEKWRLQEVVMTDSPVAAAAREYDAIARQLEARSRYRRA